jgi:hypothetical protein
LTPYTAINLGIRDYDRSDPASATNASRRLQCLAWLQQMQDYIECYPGREWYWTFAEGSLTFTAGDVFAILPTNFMEFGRNGGVFDSNKRRWDEISIHVLMRMRYEGTASSNQYVFAKAGAGLVQIPFAQSATIVLPIVYRSRPPILVDDAGTEEVPPRSSGSRCLCPDRDPPRPRPQDAAVEG